MGRLHLKPLSLVKLQVWSLHLCRATLAKWIIFMLNTVHSTRAKVHVDYSLRDWFNKFTDMNVGRGTDCIGCTCNVTRVSKNMASSIRKLGHRACPFRKESPWHRLCSVLGNTSHMVKCIVQPHRIWMDLAHSMVRQWHKPRQVLLLQLSLVNSLCTITHGSRERGRKGGGGTQGP